LPVTRLPPGRHKLTREEVRESQQLRLRAAAAEAVAELGYGRVTTTVVAQRAGVSTSTLYRYHGDLWACLLDAYVAGGKELRERTEGTCDRGGAEAGLQAALGLLAAEPALAQLLSAEPPAEATALRAARSRLLGDLAGQLARIHGAAAAGPREERLVAAAFALVANTIRVGADLTALAPVLAATLALPGE
jgi:AcrR family transcriptional regulator